MSLKAVAHFPHSPEQGIFGVSSDEYIFSKIASTGRFYEEEVLEAIATIPIKTGGIFVDVGANIGNHTAFFAGCMGRRVLAFEPEPANYKALEATASAFGKDVICHQLALGSEQGRAELWREDETNGGAFAARIVSGGPVEVRPLDDYVRDVEVRLIKVDVEGSELEVLDGSLETIERDHPIVVVEARGSLEAGMYHRYLARIGYSLLSIRGATATLILAHEGADGSIVGGIDTARAAIGEVFRRRESSSRGWFRQEALSGLSNVLRQGEEEQARSSVHDVMLANLAAEMEALTEIVTILESQGSTSQNQVLAQIESRLSTVGRLMAESIAIQDEGVSDAIAEATASQARVLRDVVASYERLASSRTVRIADCARRAVKFGRGGSLKGLDVAQVVAEAEANARRGKSI